MAGRFYATSTANINDISKFTRLWLPITLDPANQTMRVKWWDAWGLSTFDLKDQQTRFTRMKRLLLPLQL